MHVTGEHQMFDEATHEEFKISDAGFGIYDHHFFETYLESNRYQKDIIECGKTFWGWTVGTSMMFFVPEERFSFGFVANTMHTSNSWSNVATSILSEICYVRQKEIESAKDEL